jgi:hypothetical protein
MFFNEDAAVMLIGRALKGMVNDYGVKSYLIYAIASFLVLILMFKVFFDKLQVESILKLKVFYLLYFAVIASITATFTYMNYFNETSGESVLGKDPLKIKEKIREDYEIEYNKKQAEKQACELDPLCNFVKK